MIFADSDEEGAARAFVKTPSPIGRVIVEDALALGDEHECTAQSGDSSTFESLLWMRAPFLEDFAIEQLYLSEIAVSQERSVLRMRRAVFGGENLTLWERDEAEPDLFAELALGVSGLAESALAHFILKQNPDSETGGPAMPASSAFRFDSGSPIFSHPGFPTASFGAPAVVASIFPSAHGGGSHGGHPYASASSLSAVPATSFSHVLGAQSAPRFGGGLGAGGWSGAASDTDARLGMAGAPSHKPADEEDWWEVVSAAPTKDNVLTDDRFLASIKLDGVGKTWDKEGRALGKVIDLNGYSLTFTMGGILSVGERRNWIHNGTLETLSDNFEVHVLSSGHTGGGLEISAVLANALGSATGLIKTGDGELILSSPKGNTFRGDVHIKEGTLTLRATGEGPLLAGGAIYVGDGSGPATLKLKGGMDLINPLAAVTLRGGDAGEAAILRLEKTDAKGDVSQKLKKLVIEGNGVIDFGDNPAQGGSGSSPNKTALYIDELDLQGELTIRGWDPYTTKLLLNYTGMPDYELLAKIHIEGYDNLRVRRDGIGYWSVAADPIPEPAACGAIAAVGACAIVAWRRGHRLRGLRSSGRK